MILRCDNDNGGDGGFVCKPCRRDDGHDENQGDDRDDYDDSADSDGTMLVKKKNRVGLGDGGPAMPL